MKTRINIWYDQEGDFLELSIGNPTPSCAEEVRPDLFVWFDEKTREIKNIGVFNLLRKSFPLALPFLDLHLHYDYTKDDLEIRFHPSLTSTSLPLRNDIFQHVDETGKICALLINHLTRRKNKFIDFDVSLPFDLRQIPVTSIS